MPDTYAQTADELAHAAAVAVAALPGVVRLEPTLTSALRRLRAATAGRVAASEQAAYAATDGIRLARHGDLVDIHVDITATTATPANLLPQTVPDTRRDTILDHQLTPGDVTVGVLRLQP